MQAATEKKIRNLGRMEEVGRYFQLNLEIDQKIRTLRTTLSTLLASKRQGHAHLFDLVSAELILESVAEDSIRKL